MSGVPTLYKWIIVISLAVNVLLVGYMVGSQCMKGPPRHAHEARMEEALKALPAEKQAEMKAFMQGFRDGAKGNFEDIRARREELRAIMTAETFDAQAFRTKARELGAVFKANKEAMLEKTIALAEGMSQKDRAILADIMHRPMPPHKGGMPERKEP